MTRSSHLADLLRITAVSTLAFLLASTNLRAQTATATAPPHIVIETVGPDGWRARLGPTNVASMLASEEGRAIWQPTLAPLLGMWRMTVGDEEAFAAASNRIFGYGGVVRIAAQLEQGAAANVVVMLEPDGRTDLNVLATDIKELVGKAIPGEWTDLTIAGLPRAVRTMDGDAITAPVLQDGRLYLVAGQQATLGNGFALATHLLARPLMITSPKPGSPALHVVLDMPALIALNGTDNEEARISEALGLGQLQELTFSLRAAGPRVELDASMLMNGPTRGLVAALMPTTSGVSPLLQLLPSKTSAWKVGRFDCTALFDGIVDAIVSGRWGDSREEVIKDINKECGIDLRNDLLGNMTDELLVMGSPFQSFDSLDEATWLIAFRIKNEATFRTSFQTMMQQAKPMLSGSETVDVDGVELRRYGNMLNYNLWMAAGNGIFVIAAGRDAEEEASTALRAAKATKLDASKNPIAGFDDLQRFLPPGLNGVAQADIGSMVAIPTEWWIEAFNEYAMFLQGPQLDPETAEEHQERFHALLKAHNLLTMRSATGFAESRWHWRLFW